MSKLSKKLQDLADGRSPDTEVPIHILLESNISQEQAVSLVNEVERHLAGKEAIDHLKRMKMVLCTVPLASVHIIADLPGVISIDLDSQSPIEEIIDQHS